MFLTTGCATHTITEFRIKRHHADDERTNVSVQVPGNPAYYALLPLSIPFDLATGPFQLAYLFLVGPGQRAVSPREEKPRSQTRDEVEMSSTPRPSKR